MPRNRNNLPHWSGQMYLSWKRPKSLWKKLSLKVKKVQIRSKFHKLKCLKRSKISNCHRKMNLKPSIITWWTLSKIKVRSKKTFWAQDKMAVITARHVTLMATTKRLCNSPPNSTTKTPSSQLKKKRSIWNFWKISKMILYYNVQVILKHSTKSKKC